MKVLILANGKLYKPNILVNRINAAAFDLALGVDGGARYAHILNVILDVIIGDMDSLSDIEPYIKSNTKIVTYPSGKNETDLELSLLYAKEKGADKIVIAGVMGGRMDMTIANILSIMRASLDSIRIEVWHGEQTGWIIKPPVGNVFGRLGDVISLIPIAGNVSSITTKGLRYPLKNAELEFGSGRGVSNVMDKPIAHITLSKGLILVIHTPCIA